MIARPVSTNVRWVSIDCVPRTLVAIKEPIAASAMARMPSATSTSTRVNPASAGRWSQGAARNNVAPSGEPLNADFIAGAQAGNGDDAATRHARGEELDGG